MRRVICRAAMPAVAVVLSGCSGAKPPASSAAPVAAVSPATAPASAQAPVTATPSDIYPDSTARLPKVKREDLDDEGKKIYDAIVNPNTRYKAGLPPPLAMWMHSPKMAKNIFPAYMYLRFDNPFGPRLTEVAILTTAREMNSQFQWTSHEPQAREAGLEQSLIDTIKYRRSLDGVVEKEALVIQFGRELMGDRKLTSATFAHALKVFDRAGVTDLASLMAFYEFLYTVSNVTFDIQMPAGQAPLLPIP